MSQNAGQNYNLKVAWGRRGMHAGFWWDSQKEGEPKYRWEDNIKIDFREIGWGCMD
jgi:hypothetical protein